MIPRIALDSCIKACASFCFTLIFRYLTITFFIPLTSVYRLLTSSLLQTKEVIRWYIVKKNRICSRFDIVVIPHSTVILREYFKSIPLNPCNIARIFIKLLERFLKYCRNLAMSAQNIINTLLIFHFNIAVM